MLEQQKWVTKLFGYDYEILYKSSRGNYTTDELSRVEGCPRLNTLFMPEMGL